MPAAPRELRLPLGRAWNGEPVEDRRLHGFLAVSAEDGGLRVRGGLPDPAPGPAPQAPPGTRVANLWETDVVELFWVGPEGHYVEIELGAHGHFLVLGFDAPRVCVNEHATLALRLEHKRGEGGWETATCIPWEVLPQPLEALGGFGLARGAFLAAHPLPGPAPDFHQPREFPRACLAPGARAR